MVSVTMIRLMIVCKTVTGFGADWLKKIRAANAMSIPITIASQTAMVSGAVLPQCITAVSATEIPKTIVSRIVMESGEEKQSWTGVVFAVVTAPSAVKTAP